MAKKKKKIYLEDTLNEEELANWRWKMSIPIKVREVSPEELEQRIKEKEERIKKLKAEGKI